MEHLLVIVRIEEDTVADLPADDLVNVEGLALLHFERPAVAGRDHEFLDKSGCHDQSSVNVGTCPGAAPSWYTASRSPSIRKSGSPNCCWKMRR